MNPYVLFVFCLFVFLVISHFDFEGGTLVLIALYHAHCLLLYFFCFYHIHGHGGNHAHTNLSIYKETTTNICFPSHRGGSSWTLASVDHVVRDRRMFGNNGYTPVYRQPPPPPLLN